ncbi:MAG: MFS transporter [Burkholderiales bacterium]|jgi:UMF1 family MFS transporter|nr:MFS transporter [Betaproteobacteria bacterium]
MRTALNPGVAKREVFAWAMYDFANSGYTTVVLTAVFNAYFVSVICNGAPWATFAWTATLAVSYLGVMVLGPIIGAYADAHAAKKRVLMLVTTGCVAATAGLYAATSGDLALTAALVIISNFCYAIGENITAAFLPELAAPEAMGKVSGWGWSLGYVGGLLALGLCLAWIMTAESRGGTTSGAVPMTNLITAAVYSLGAIVTFIWLRERATPTAVSSATAWARLVHTARDAARYKDLVAMFICGACYQAGVATIITLAAIYAQEVMGFKTTETLMLVLVVNITACIGAFGFGYVQDAIGKKRALMVTLLIWIAMVLFAWFATTPALFWVAANLAGVAMGSSQSAGRAMVAFFSPVDRAAEFFGLWGVATRLAAIAGPLTYGAVSWASGGNHRLAMLITGVFFVAAIVALVQVNESRGRAVALTSDANSPFGG